MAVKAIFMVVLLALLALFLSVRLKKLIGKKGFPTCFKCDLTMAQQPVSQKIMPKKMASYLAEHKLPLNVVRRFKCVKCHKEKWVAPPVTGSEKGLIV